MNDLIERQAAIDAMATWDWQELYLPIHFKQLLEELPSAQPDHFPEVTKKVDLIDRQAAIDALSKLMDTDGFRDGWAVSRMNVKCMLESLPSAQPEQRWIPCSERLPEDDTDVLISYRYEEGEGDSGHVEIDITSYGDMYFGGNAVHDPTGRRVKHWRQPFEHFTSNNEVIAWMPLSEPYREEGENDG